MSCTNKKELNLSLLHDYGWSQLTMGKLTISTYTGNIKDHSELKVMTNYTTYRWVAGSISDITDFRIRGNYLNVKL